MEYIDFNEFQNQPKKIQKVFLDWWQPKYFDLLHCDCGTTFSGYYDGEENISYYDFNTKQREWISKYNAIPLFTEGQLRQFIENKTNAKVTIEYYESIGIDISIYNLKEQSYITGYSELDLNLLQVYWKVACRIAKEEIKNEN